MQYHLRWIGRVSVRVCVCVFGELLSKLLHVVLFHVIIYLDDDNNLFVRYESTLYEIWYIMICSSSPVKASKNGIKPLSIGFIFRMFTIRQAHVYISDINYVSFTYSEDWDGVCWICNRMEKWKFGARKSNQRHIVVGFTFLNFTCDIWNLLSSTPFSQMYHISIIET